MRSNVVPNFKYNTFNFSFFIYQNILRNIDKKKRKNILWSHELWLWEGNQNSKFFHTSTLVWKRRNVVLTIKDDQRWILDKHGIAKYFIDNFNSLFTSSNLDMLRNLKHLFATLVIEEENATLIKIPIEKEIKECV